MKYITKSIWLLAFTVVICCIIYPAAVWLIGQTCFKFQADGSMLNGPDGNPVGWLEQDMKPAGSRSGATQ